MNRTMQPYLSEPALVCACGRGRDALWNAVIRADSSAIRIRSTADGSRSFPVAACDIPLPPSAAAAGSPDGTAASPQDGSHDTKILRMEGAALEGLDQAVAAALERYGRKRLAVIVGSCDNASETSLAGHRQFFKDGSFPAGYTLAMQGAAGVARCVQDRYGTLGPAVSSASACSSSSAAFARASQLIRGGIADAVIVGGADIASDLVLLGFAAMECISPRPTNPFSRNRCGITLGEAAVLFVLSKDPLSPGRPAVTLAGCGESADAYHITSPDPDGSGAAAAMRLALRSAGIRAEDVGYVNLHGTGTELNDAMEARAVAAVIGCRTPCSATKSITGHSLGAAGALSLAACYEALVRNAGSRDVTLLAQAWDGEYDEALPRLNIVGKENNRLSTGSGSPGLAGGLRACMSNSFGFGGANVSLILQLEAGHA